MPAWIFTCLLKFGMEILIHSKQLNPAVTFLENCHALLTYVVSIKPNMIIISYHWIEGLKTFGLWYNIKINIITCYVIDFHSFGPICLPEKRLGDIDGRSRTWKSMCLMPLMNKHKIMGFLSDSQNWGMCMRRECRERFPRHRRLAIPTCITARA